MKPVILIIDDQQETIDLCSLLIRSDLSEYGVLSALDGLRGIQIAQNDRPELILLDVKMPNMDGYEVCRRLKSDPATRTIPVLMISGVLMGSKHRTAGFDAGAEGYVCKPFEAEELLAQIRSLLRLKKLTDTLQAHEQSLKEGLRQRTDEWAESEQKFRMLFEHSPDAIFLENSAGIVLDVNEAGCRLHGVSREELIGRSVMDLVPPALRSETERLFPKWFSGEMTQYTGWSLDARGREIPVEIRATRLSYQDQPALLLHVRDISDRERIQFRLSQLNECLLEFGSRPLININRLTSLIGRLLNADGVLYSRLESEQLRTTGIWSRAAGFHITDLTQGLLCRKVIEAESDRPMVVLPTRDPGKALFDLHKQDADCRTYIGQLVKVKDRAQGVLALFFHPEVDPDPEDLKFVRIIASAISVEEERLHLESVLCQREEQYRMLIEAAPLAVILVQDHRIVFSNRSAAGLFGLETSAMMLTLDPRQLVSESHREALNDRLARPDNPLQLPLPEVTELRRMDGTLFPAEEYITSTLISGQPMCQIIWIDITKRHATEATLKRSEDQLRLFQKMDALGRLSGGIAHDFNNLLTVIFGYAHLIGESPGFPPVLRGDLAEIVHAGKRAEYLVHSLLTFSRNEPLHVAPIDLNQILLNMDRLLRRSLGTDIDLVTLPEDHLGTVMADVGQIEQVIMNLAINARAAMVTNGRLTIQTRRCPYRIQGANSPSEDCVLLEVSDTGCGMSPEVRERAFEPFFTTRSKGQGTGLGLAIVYGIVHQNGGQIELESAVGQGTHVRMFFPRLNAPAEHPSVRGSMPAARGTETLLLVEDEPALSRLTSYYLRSLGYQVIEACNGQEGLTVFRSRKEDIHLVLTDVVMPLMGGFEMIRSIQKEKRNIPVLYITGFAHSNEFPVSISPDEVLHKPYTQEEIANRVRQQLDAKTKPEANQ